MFAGFLLFVENVGNRKGIVIMYKDDLISKFESKTCDLEKIIINPEYKHREIGCNLYLNDNILSIERDGKLLFEININSFEIEDTSNGNWHEITLKLKDSNPYDILIIKALKNE